jgi:hypothetical protein
MEILSLKEAVAQKRRMYTGTLINDLLVTAERVRDSLKGQRENPLAVIASGLLPEDRSSQPKQFPQALGLSTANGNLGLLLIVHPELVRALEPGDDFANAVDVHEVGAVRTPK